jgi:hypothetical protein
MVQDPKDAVNYDAQFMSPKAAMDNEAIKSANGTLYPPRKVTVRRKVETGDYRIISGTNYSFSDRGGFLGGFSNFGANINSEITSQGSGQSRNSTFKREVPILESKAVEKEVPVKVVYPSPASASHAQVLETFFADNLYEGNLPLRPTEKTIPILLDKLNDANRSAKQNPSLEGSENATRARATIVYNMLSEAEDAYKMRLTKGEDKDKAALNIIETLYESKQGNPIIKSGNPSSASIVGSVQGSGKEHRFGETTYDGSAAQLFNYYMAVKRNENKYVPGGQTYADYFAKAPKGAYAPSPANRISFDSIPTVSQTKEDAKEKMFASLDADLKAIKKLPPSNFSGSGILPPAIMSSALEAMKKDAEDGTIGNNSELYKGPEAIAIKLSTLLEANYNGRTEPTPEEARSINSVINADPSFPSKLFKGTPLTSDLAKDIQVAARHMTESKLFANVSEPSETATGLPKSMKPKPIETGNAKINKR